METQFTLPEVDFLLSGGAEATPGILGRDAIFTYFDLRMTSSIIELTEK